MKKIKEGKMELDRKLLLDIFHIAAPSRKEHNMSMFIRNFLAGIDVPFDTDEKGNIFSFDNGAVPFLNAHMDTVQDSDDANLANFIKIKNNRILMGLGVIGGDDKCGIYAMLHILREKKHKINFAFSVEEEVGTIGARFLALNNIPELEACLYGITLDRRGSSDIICFSNDYGTKQFDDALETIGKEYGFKSVMGVLSDADVYSNHISCANLSVGYHGAHSKKEFVLIPQLEKTMNFLDKILREIKVKFGKPEKYTYGGTAKTRKTWGRGAYGGGYHDAWGYEDNYDYYKNQVKTDLWDEDIESYYEKTFADNYSDTYKPKTYMGVCSICGSNSQLTFFKTLKQSICAACAESLYEELSDTIDETALVY